MSTASGQPLLLLESTTEPRETKTVRLVPFEVPEGVEALALRFDYQPRSCKDESVNVPLVEGALARHVARLQEPERSSRLEALRNSPLRGFRSQLNNLMNVVLIDPRGRWRGRWDRNPSSDDGALLLGRSAASRGFIPGKIEPGTWRCAIECHGVFGAPVRWTLRVETRSSQEEAALAEKLARVPAARGEPPSGGRRWYFGEMHSHTVHSDGRFELGELAERAHAGGCEFLALTDHNTTSGLLERQRLPVVLVPGCELTTFWGHHPIYGIPEEIVPWHREGRVRPFAEIAAEVRALGGVTSLAHPYAFGDPVCTGCRAPEGLDPGSFDLLEVWYRRWDGFETADNEASYALWNRLWREGRPVTAVGSRDLHRSEHEASWPGPLPLTAVFAEDASAPAIVEGLRRGEVVVSGGPLLTFSLRADSGEARIGQTLRAPRAELAVHLERLDGPAELRVFRSGERVHSEPVRADGDRTWSDLADRPGWYRVELWRDGLPRALTNHVVLSA